MGIVVPEAFPMSSLANDEERLVVESLRDQLSDGWLVFPDVRLTGERDWQLDIVIAHAQEGIAVIEVQGHRVRIVGGQWCCDGRALQPQPFTQARNHAYELRNQLRLLGGPLAIASVDFAVAFPNTSEVQGSLPADLRRPQVLASRELGDLREAVELMMAQRGRNRPIGDDGLAALVELLRPGAAIEWDPDARARSSRHRLETICADQVRTLERLDANRKVVITGTAGTGKTRLALAWARRAMIRGERVLLTCANELLGHRLTRRFEGDGNLRVGSFAAVALALDGMTELEIPADASSTWWDTVAVGHLHGNWPKVTQRFDTIIVDEAQDFSPAWIALLTALLDPLGARRVMLLVDPVDGAGTRGFALPSPDDGWTMCELANDCRSAHDIARILRRLGGAASPISGPASPCVDWVEAGDLDSAVALAGQVRDRLIGRDGHDPARVLFATVTDEMRDRLRADLGLVAHEVRADSTMVCEHVHRVAGLEYDHVVLVAATDVPSPLLYAGVGRAISGLTVVAPRSVADRLGVAR